MRLRVRGPRHITGWVHGLIEGADPDASQPPAGEPQGVLEGGENLVATQTGKLAVRGGSGVAQTFTEPGTAALTAMLALAPFSQTGAVAVGFHAGTSKTFAYRLTDDLAFTTGSEATSRHDLGWTAAAAPRPVLAELFEKVYIVDATPNIGNRQALVSLDASGTVTTPTFDLGGGAAVLKPYCAAVFNGVLFIAGYDKASHTDEPALLRHSFLGAAPDSANGFDATAWEMIGAAGQRITGLAAGRSLLMVAKEHELYRLTGAGQANPGFQYAVQQLDNSPGFGVVNPYALAHFEGYWYGIGEAGPWRSDGDGVESMVGTRRRSWPKVTQLPTAFVTVHPERRVVLFGFCMAPPAAGRSTTVPWVLWLWDVDRECWTCNWTFNADFLQVAAIPTATASAPSADVGNGGGGGTDVGGAPIVDHTLATLSSVHVSWDNNGDVDSSTELWVRDVTGGAGSVLWAIADPGVAVYTLTGLSDTHHYAVKARHVRGTIAGGFTAEADAYTKLATPGTPTRAFYTSVSVKVRTIQNANGADLTLTRDGVLLHTFSAAATGTYDYTDIDLTCGTYYNYDAQAYMASWPAVLQYSDIASVALATKDCGGGL